MRGYVEEPTMTLRVKNYFIDFYEKPNFLANYIISVDVAGGLERDFSAFSIIAPDDFRIVGDFRSNKIGVDDYKLLLEELMTTFFSNAILIIERNSYGLPMIQYFMKIPNIERRMYRELNKSAGQRKQKDGLNVVSKTRNFIYGVDTTKKSRDLMFELLPSIIDNEGYKF